MPVWSICANTSPGAGCPVPLHDWHESQSSMFRALPQLPLHRLFPLSMRLHGWFITSTEKL
jgi:hypothetical protein